MVSRVNIVGYDCGAEYDPDGYYVKYADYAALGAQLAEARKALDAVKAENVKLRHIADEQIRAEFAARQALKHLQSSGDWYYQNRPIVEIAKEASGFEEALEVIAGSHWERVGYCQSDVEDVPDLTAVEAQSHARATLQRFRAARRALEGEK